MKFPSILVLHEKHGDYYYLMENTKDVIDFALELLKERYEAGFYVAPEITTTTFDNYFLSVHNMSLKDAEQLVEQYGDSVKLGIRTPANEIAALKKSYLYAQAEDTEYNDILEAICEENGLLAWEVLNKRNRDAHEYEEFSVRQIENKSSLTIGLQV